MADFVFNIAKGKIAYYATLPAASDALAAVLLKTSGIEADSILKDHDTLSALLAAANDECTGSGYARVGLLSVTVGTAGLPDDTNDRIDMDCADFVFPLLGADTISKLIICYVPVLGTGTYLNTGGSADTAWIPLTAHDLSTTTDGTDLNVSVANFARAS